MIAMNHRFAQIAEHFARDRLYERTPTHEGFADHSVCPDHAQAVLV
ncbi:hypothetical protein NBRC111894_4501 [Sporolactobacillus inulinus]|uniref:Uncharacterized protein n=1 Tax=Sporolactobacillus inulinus TaxID=2078 RepID=A0A4Y1ZIH3_9BACL|nr:hypothetical protein NBRC111894_4501 [Sporolactobacillus inulinus]